MNVELLLPQCDATMSDGWRLMMGGGKRKRLRTTEQITPNNTKQIRVPGTSPRAAPNKNSENDRCRNGEKLLQEAATQTDAVTPGRSVQAGWLNLPQNDLNPFPPVEPVTLPSLRATRRCRAATDMG